MTTPNSSQKGGGGGHRHTTHAYYLFFLEPRPTLVQKGWGGGGGHGHTTHIIRTTPNSSPKGGGGHVPEMTSPPNPWMQRENW